MSYTPVTSAEFSNYGHDDWRVILHSVQALFRTGSFPAATRFATAVAEAAEAHDHHPDIDIRYPDRVIITMSTHVTGGLSMHDVDLAGRISALAASVGATSEPACGQMMEIALDTMDVDRIRPFWMAVLGYCAVSEDAIVDPLRIGPAMWFQQMDEPRTDRDRFHLDISVPHDVAEARVAAAIAAGGHLVSDSFARSWWILADADGNEACVCTWQDRDGR